MPSNTGCACEDIARLLGAPHIEDIPSLGQGGGSIYRSPEACGLPREKIWKLAENIRNKCGITSNRSLADVVRSLNGKITYISWNDDKQNEALLVEPDGEFNIRLSAHTGILRDTFTIGHELGHRFLHWPLIKRKHPGRGMRATKSAHGPDGKILRHDLEADWFAAAFVMPAAEFAEAYEKGVASTLFLVPEQYVEQRAKSLGLSD